MFRIIIKNIEAKINHDVKAIEYFIKEKLEKINLNDLREWVHFGLTSQDINNSAFPLMIKNAYREKIVPEMKSARQGIYEFAMATKDIPIVLITAGGQKSDLEAGKAAGADDYFTKPFSPTALVKKIEAIIANHC